MFEPLQKEEKQAYKFDSHLPPIQEWQIDLNPHLDDDDRTRDDDQTKAQSAQL